MKIIQSILVTVFNGLLLFVLLFAVGRTDDLYFDAGNAFPFSQGNASGDKRSATMQQLPDFQDGYTSRDPSQVDAFAIRLFSADNIVILGTMPDETYIGHEQAARLIESDWKYWGDCRFLMKMLRCPYPGMLPGSLPLGLFAWMGSILSSPYDCPVYWRKRTVCGGFSSCSSSSI